MKVNDVVKITNSLNQDGSAATAFLNTIGKIGVIESVRVGDFYPYRIFTLDGKCIGNCCDKELTLYKEQLTFSFTEEICLTLDKRSG